MAGKFTVTVTVPDGATLQQPSFPQDCTVTPDGHSVSCPFRAGLQADQTATASVPVQLDPSASGTLTGQVAVSSADDPDSTNHTASFAIQVTG